MCTEGLDFFSIHGLWWSFQILLLKDGEEEEEESRRERKKWRRDRMRGGDRKEKGLEATPTGHQGVSGLSLQMWPSLCTVRSTRTLR